MSKSVPTGTQQVTSYNPTQAAQLPHLQSLWDAGSWLAGVGPQDPIGTKEYLDPLGNYAQNQFANTMQQGGWLMPGALNFANQALTGQFPQGQLPAGPQIRQLGDMGNAAAQAGQQYAAPLAASGVAAQTVGGGYGDYLASLVPGAIGSGTGYGNAIANAAGQAPGTAAPYSAGLRGLSGAAANIGNPAIGGLYGNAGMGISGNPIYNSLMGAASGEFLDPNRNPALAGTVKAATDPLVRQYQTATAPQSESGFEGAGRYGSGAMANARSVNEQNLIQGLRDTTSGIVSNAYNTGLSSMLSAGQSLGQAYNTGTANISDALARAGQLGQTGIQNAGQLLNQGGTLDLGALSSMMSGFGTAGQVAGQGYQTGAQTAANAAQAANQGYAVGGNMLQGAGALANQGYGTGIQGTGAAATAANQGMLNLSGLAQISPELANYPMSALTAGYNSLWSPMQNFSGLLGTPAGGTGQTNTSGTQQQSIPSNILGGALGIASLAQKI